jgi:hypothetical protein
VESISMKRQQMNSRPVNSRPRGQLRWLSLIILVIAAGCSSSEEPAAEAPASTLPLAAFPPEECITRGWEQEPTLTVLADDPETPIETLPDAQQVRAMDIVVGCFDRATLAGSFAQIQTPFPVPESSADCLAGLMIENQSGAAFLGFSAYIADEPPMVTTVDLRSPTVAVLAGCVPPTALAYSMVLQPFLEGAQNGAVNRSCVERGYMEQTDPVKFWGASYDIVVLDQSIEPNNRIVYEPGFDCVSFGTAYALSVQSETGASLSSNTVACIDQYLDQVDAVESLVTTGSNQTQIDEAALTCLSPDEKVTFGIGE